MSALRWWTSTGTCGCFWTLRGVRFGGTWTLGTNIGARPGSTEVPQIQFIDFVVEEPELEYIIMRQTTVTFGICSVPWFARAVRTWKMVHYSPASSLWQPFLGVCVLVVEYGTLDSSGDDFVPGAMLESLHALFALGTDIISTSSRVGSV